MQKRNWLVSLALVIIGILVWFFYWKLFLSPFLTFSDAAKFADIARNLITGKVYGVNFAFFGAKPEITNGLFSTVILPAYPLFLMQSFKFFGISDFTVVLTSGVFYLAGTMTIYFLGKKVFGELVGILASLAFIFDPAMLDYATSGASESLFIFEIILAALFFYRNTKVSQFFGFFILLSMYFTRPSAIIYIAGFVLFFILLRFKKKTQILKVGGIAILVWLLIEVVLTKFSGKFFLYSSLTRFFGGTAKFAPTTASTAFLRGGGMSLASGLKPFLSKVFYNLYNFYKLLPQILSPYLAAFFFLSLFRWEKEREKRVFRLAVLLMVAATFFVSAAFLPIYRYLHPVIPFIYLLAIEMLVWTVGKVVSSQWSVVRKSRITPGLAFGSPRAGSYRSLITSHRSLVTAISFLLLFVFVVGQTTGKIFLDSRFLQAHTNPDKPPVYVQLSWLLKENTNPDDLIITNLDTWGSWYGERKTIWFPLQPEQLIPKQGRESKIDAIYLTSYKMDDENYFMGEEWQGMFYQPEQLEDPFFAENFELAGKFEIAPEETYEREGATAILLRRTK